jgi:hypothetical protein
MMEKMGQGMARLYMFDTYIALRTRGLWVQGSEHLYRWSIHFAEQQEAFGHSAGGESANVSAVGPRERPYQAHKHCTAAEGLCSRDGSSNGSCRCCSGSDAQANGIKERTRDPEAAKAGLRLLQIPLKLGHLTSELYASSFFFQK